MPDYIIRDGVVADIPGMYTFILEHGPNEWNDLPHEDVRRHLKKIASKDVGAILAEQNGALIGFVSFHLTADFGRYQTPERKGVQGYVAVTVVHREHTGRGVGSNL